MAETRETTAVIVLIQHLAASRLAVQPEQRRLECDSGHDSAFLVGRAMRGEVGQHRGQQRGGSEAEHERSRVEPRHAQRGGPHGAAQRTAEPGGRDCLERAGSGIDKVTIQRHRQHAHHADDCAHVTHLLLARAD
eukprot:CAMPEP_0185323266 /NCGR_PEP_ID=MMETSP1363-20130426/61416_1 /TAXON_ID=38817 /ORGANISM="Gephyrocapsa oceanica, Strain RCC1303" /LENGTH=134 /DNA_ID=CAMNT_0027921845 /DNA_START=37 /DNA_END=441 /DNA_ORIENTATION=-